MTERHNREDSMKHTLQLNLREYCDCQGHLPIAFEFQFHEGFSPLLFGPLFPQLSNGDAELSERTQALIVKAGQCCVSVGYKGYGKLLPLFLECLILVFVLGPQLWTKPVERPAPPLPAPPALLPAAQGQGPCVPDRPSDVSG